MSRKQKIKLMNGYFVWMTTHKRISNELICISINKQNISFLYTAIPFGHDRDNKTLKINENFFYLRIKNVKNLNSIKNFHTSTSIDITVSMWMREMTEICK